MIRRLRTLAATALLLGASGVAHAQHDAKPAAGHSTPATDKSGHAEAKPAAPPHPSKPSGPAPAHAASPSAAKVPAPVSAEHAVAKIVNALDRELGKPAASSPHPARRAAAPARPPKVSLSWRVQLVWPEPLERGESVQVQWPK